MCPQGENEALPDLIVRKGKRIGELASTEEETPIRGGEIAEKNPQGKKKEPALSRDEKPGHHLHKRDPASQGNVFGGRQVQMNPYQ